MFFQAFDLEFSAFRLAAHGNALTAFQVARRDSVKLKLMPVDSVIVG